MIQPVVLAEGRFRPEDLIVSVGESNRRIVPELEAQIEPRWEELQERAAREGRVCYNGISYRLDALATEGDKVRLRFSPLEYKVRQILPGLPGYANLPSDCWRRGAFAAATVRTADDRYLIVELTGTSMNQNECEVLGGLMEKPIELRGGEDVFACLYAELEEEARITRADIETCVLRAIFLGHSTNAGFYFEVSLNVPSSELLARFESEARDPDIKALQALTREEYATFLQEASLDKHLYARLTLGGSS